MADGRSGIGQICLHQIDAGEEFIGGIYALQGFARNAHEAGQTRAGADEYRFIAHFEQFINGQHLADDHIGFDIHAQIAQIIHFLIHNRLGQTELRNAVGQNAARNVQRFIHGYLVAHLRQIARAGQTRRTCADHGDLVAVLRRRRHLLGGMFAMPVGNEALQTADADGFALDAANALAFALGFLRAYATADRRQGRLLIQHFERAFDILFGDLRDERGNIDAYRTGRYAGMILAVQAAPCFVNRHIIGITRCNLFKNLVAIVRRQRRHRALGHGHILFSHFI